VDASIFSTALCYYAFQHALKSADPLDILEQAFQSVQRDRDVVAGSSTATVVALNADTGQLSAANLGDSTFLVVRQGRVVYTQPSQQYYFNCPKQLAKMPKRWREPGSIEDSPSDADLVHDMQLQDGDLVLVATDGIIDNLFKEDIEKILEIFPVKDHASLQQFAHSWVFFRFITTV
jgi:protein phosphatase PTC7